MTLVVTISDMRKSGFCVAGIKTWFAGHGLDFRAFQANGYEIDAEVLEATGDALAQRAIDRAKERQRG